MDARDQNPINATPETTRVVVANYACMSITLITLITRFVLVNLRWKRRFGWDDVLLYSAALIGIGESISIEHAVRRGLGTYIRPGNSSKLMRLSQLVYTSDLLFLVVMFLAKLSVVRLVYRFASRSALSRGKLMLLQILLVIWITFSVPAVAFQCGTPLPWLYLPERCAGSGALWYPTIIFSILLDAWVAVCAWTALPEIQCSAKQRQTILGLFSSRVLVCILQVAQIALLSSALKDINQPRAMPNPTMLKQIVMNGAIFTATIPILCKALACYQPPPQAVVYGEERQATTPLEDIKFPRSASVSTKHDNLSVKELEVDGRQTPAPSLGNGKDDFRTDFEFAFNKEIGMKV